jgi:hypothetical protein
MARPWSRGPDPVCEYPTPSYFRLIGRLLFRFSQARKTLLAVLLLTAKPAMPQAENAEAVTLKVWDGSLWS